MQKSAEGESTSTISASTCSAPPHVTSQSWTRAVRWATSVRPGAGQHASGVRARMRRSPERGLGEVAAVELHQPRHVEVAAARHLPEAGEPGPHGAPQRPRTPESNVSRISPRERPRPDEAHVAPQHVPAAAGARRCSAGAPSRAAAEAMRGSRASRKKLNHSSRAAVVGGQELVEQVVAVDHHRAQLQQAEGPPVTALPLVAEEDRARVAQGHRQRGEPTSGAAARARPARRRRRGHARCDALVGFDLIGTGGRPRRPPRGRRRSSCPGARAGAAGRRAGGRDRARSGRSAIAATLSSGCARRAPPSGWARSRRRRPGRSRSAPRTGGRRGGAGTAGWRSRRRGDTAWWDWCTSPGQWVITTSWRSIHGTRPSLSCSSRRLGLVLGDQRVGDRRVGAEPTARGVEGLEQLGPELPAPRVAALRARAGR